MNWIHLANDRSTSSLASSTGIALSLSFEEESNALSSLTAGDSSFSQALSMSEFPLIKSCAGIAM